LDGVKHKGRESTFAETEVRSEMSQRERKRGKAGKVRGWVVRWARPTGTTWVESDKV
jgi:hypothetical protein